MNNFIEINRRSLSILKDNDDRTISEASVNTVDKMWKYLIFVLKEEEEKCRILSNKENMSHGDLIEELQIIDSTRRNLHNSAIFGINICNKFCIKLGIPLVYDGDCDDDHREEIFFSIKNFFFGDANENDILNDIDKYL